MAGAAGAWEAGPRTLDAALGNPAALSTRQGVDLMLSAGTSLKGGASLGTAVLSIPVDEALNLAFSWHAMNGGTQGGYLEQSAGLSAAFEVNQGLGFGARIHALQVSPLGPGTSATGLGVDLGVRGRMPLGPRHSLILGGGARNLAKGFSDRQWEKAVPVIAKAGLGLAWSHRLLVSSELSRELPVRATDPALDTWRLGGEWRSPAGWSLRSGISTERLQRYALGAGWEWGTEGLRAHYALHADEGVSVFNHRVQLEWGFAQRTRPSVSVAPLEIRYEEGSKRVKEAKLALNIQEEQKAEAWTLEIRDKNGNVVRVISGEGTPPGYVSWDGKDMGGGWVEDGEQVTYKLSIKTPDGDTSSRPLLAGDFQIGGSLADFGLQSQIQSALPALVPVLGADGQTERFAIKMPSAPANAEAWKVVIRDAQGNTLKIIEGQGPLPEEVLWDGKTKEGLNLRDGQGLQISLVAVDGEGRISEIMGTVHHESAVGLDWGEERFKEQMEMRLTPFNPGGYAWTMALSDASLAELGAYIGPMPTPVPTEAPTAMPTAVPTARPTAVPTEEPTAKPTEAPTEVPTARPTAVPTEEPTAKPTAVPTEAPTARPTAVPTEVPTARPTAVPTAVPTARPTAVPTAVPTARPTALPTEVPTARPTREPAEPAPIPSPTPKVLSDKASIKVRSRLGGTRMAFAFLPQPTPGVPRLLSPGAKPVFSTPFPEFIDVFQPGSDKLDKAKERELNAACRRIGRTSVSLLRLTGCFVAGEEGEAALSRARAQRLSEWLEKRGAYRGEFVIHVLQEPSAKKGVRIEILR